MYIKNTKDSDSVIIEEKTHHLKLGNAIKKSDALRDVVDGLKAWPLCLYMAIRDIRRRYRRTTLGPFWTTISLSIMMFTMGILFTFLWKTDIKTFLPFFASGFICWSFISSLISEGAITFISVEGLIKQIAFPYSAYAWLVVLRNCIVVLHHSIVYFGIAIILSVPVGLNLFMILPAMLLYCITGFWIAILVGMTCARFRDFQQVITNILQIVIFLTPIYWQPSQVSQLKFGYYFVQLNPFYHYIQIMRAPLLGQPVEAFSLQFVLLFTILGLGFTYFMFSKYYRKIVFWA